MTKFILAHTELLVSSYYHFFHERLTELASSAVMADKLYNADFALLSHDGAENPCFNYANKRAQELFEFSWHEFQGMPSKFSAEPDLREERENMLAMAAKNGFYRGYKGVRISKSGKRFFIDNCTIFNLIDEENNKVGQGAVFADWTLL